MQLLSYPFAAVSQENCLGASPGRSPVLDMVFLSFSSVTENLLKKSHTNESAFNCRFYEKIELIVDGFYATLCWKRFFLPPNVFILQDTYIEVS